MLFFNLFNRFKFAPCLLLFSYGLATAAPFEIKVHDELIADYQHSAYEIETNLFQAPTSQGFKSNVFQTRLEYGYGITKKVRLAPTFILATTTGLTM